MAAIPSLSVFTVIARSISSGFTHGLMTAIGIVIGDIIFILVAIYSLAAIAGATMTSLLILINNLQSNPHFLANITEEFTQNCQQEVERAQESLRNLRQELNLQSKEIEQLVWTEAIAIEQQVYKV